MEGLMPITYTMIAIAEFQHTFEDSELMHGGLEGVEPADTAMEALVMKLENTLRPTFLPRRVELEAHLEPLDESAREG